MGKPTGLAKEQQRALGDLKRVLGVERFYLAGGSAIAYHLRHRRSNDLDLFSNDSDLDLDLLREDLQTLEARVVATSGAAIKATVGGARIDIVRYPYPPLETPTAGPQEFPVAGLLDLAVMKLSAIARRGIARDFWDLHQILHAGISLEDAALGFVKRYGKADSDLYHVMMSLAYFDDAERDFRPVGLSHKHWQGIKAFFTVESPRLLRWLVARERP